MNLLRGNLPGCKPLAALFLGCLAITISAQTHAKMLKDWLYWNSYAEWESYSTQHSNNEYDAGSSWSLLSTGLDAYYGNFSGHIYGSYREDTQKKPELERVQVAWSPTTWMTLSAGQNYLPFSYINTLSVSYAPTASLGLTFRENITLSLSYENFYFSAYTYKTDLKYWDITQEDGATDDNLDNFGGDFTLYFPGNVVTVGCSYLSNLGDSDLFAAIFPDAAYMTEEVPVSAAYASVFWKRFGFIIEAIEANKPFSENDFYGLLDGLKLRATNAEMAYYFSSNAWILVGYRTTYMADITGLPAESYVLGLSNSFYNKRANIGFELNQTKPYPNAITLDEEPIRTGFAFKLALSY
ncbi:MAG: hypothetical protein U5M23_01180 [Marinagarivorans sp.]|nr:hypothetical protein [Marinagarivorans sp.]